MPLPVLITTPEIPGDVFRVAGRQIQHTGTRQCALRTDIAQDQPVFLRQPERGIKGDFRQQRTDVIVTQEETRR